MRARRLGEPALRLLVAFAAGCGARSQLLDAIGTAGAGGSAGAGVAVSARSVSASSDHACAVTNQGAVKCWGSNADGQLGDGSTSDSRIPVDVVGLSSDVVAVSAGVGHNCAVKRTGAVKCWGWNEFGQVGDGTLADQHVPVDVVRVDPNVAAVTCGNGFSCALTVGGHVQCWGRTLPPARDAPTDVPGLASGVASVSGGVAAGDEQACVVTSKGSAKCWGSNANGELGDGSGASSAIPVDVQGLSVGVSGISAGNSFTCAVTTAGGVKCWGGDFGEFGASHWGGVRLPLDVPGLSSSIVSVSAGNVQACVRTSSGGARCWGDNDRGQLGNGTTTKSSAPVDVIGLSSGVKEISAGASFTCAVTDVGAVKCWGANSVGQLGNGTTVDSQVPIDVVGL